MTDTNALEAKPWDNIDDDARTEGLIDRDALERFLTAHAPLAPPARNRITRLH